MAKRRKPKKVKVIKRRVPPPMNQVIYDEPMLSFR
jgi:hypothetical protein